MWYAAAAAEHLVSRGQPVVTSVTGESRATGPFNLSTNTSQQTSESKGASHTQVSTYLWTLSERGGGGPLYDSFPKRDCKQIQAKDRDGKMLKMIVS